MQFLKHQFVLCAVLLCLIVSRASLVSAQNFIQPRDNTNQLSPTQAKELESVRSAIQASGDQYAVDRALQDVPLPLRYPKAPPKKSNQPKATTGAIATSSAEQKPSNNYSTPAIVIPFNSGTGGSSAGAVNAHSEAGPNPLSFFDFFSATKKQQPVATRPSRTRSGGTSAGGALSTMVREYSAVLLIVGAFICLISALFAGAALARRQAYRRRSKQMIRLRVALPKKESSADKEKEVTHDYKEALAGAEQLFSSLHGVYNGFGFFAGQDYFGLEVSIRNSAAASTTEQTERAQVEFFVLTLPQHRETFEKQILAFYPDADICAVKDATIFAPGVATKAAYFSQRANRLLPFKTYKNIQEDALNAFINGLAQVKVGEGAAIQILFESAGNSWLTAASALAKSLQEGKGESGDSFFSMLTSFNDSKQSQQQVTPIEQEKSKAVGEKMKKVGFQAVVRIVTTAPVVTTAEANLRTIVSSFSQVEESTSNALVPNFGADTRTADAYRTMSFVGPDTPMLLNSEELATIAHLPDHRFNQAPTIYWLSFRKVPAPSNTPLDGISLGTNDFHNITTDIRIKRDDRTRHFYCIGKSGSGKSTLLEYMIKQDIRNGEGVCVIDPHGDLAEAVLPYIPKERAKDVIYFNPGDISRPVGLNLLEAPPDKRDFITGQAMQIFIKLFGEEVFGPRLQHYFRNACLTLMEDEEEGGTLIEVPRLFIDPEFQKRKVAKVKNPVVRAFWEKEMANTGDREKQEMIPYLTSKFGQFITDSTVRNIIGQPVSGLDLRKAMDEQKIVLINLAKGVIGEQNMSLMGMILIAKIQMAAMGRFDMAAKDRKDFYLYVDEFQNFATDSFSSILSEARKYRLNLVVAHQYIKQLKDEIRDAVFGNVGSMMCFKIGATDAEYMAKEFAPVYSEQDIVNIPNYKAYIKLCIDNATSTAFSLNTVWDKTGKNEALGEKIKALARMKLGRPKEVVDEETRARAGG